MAESQVFQSLWAQRQQLTLVDGLLYRKREDVGGRGGNPGLQLVLPRTLVTQLLLLMHDNATVGNAAKIRSQFYWVGQCKDVEEWCRRCIECASRKSPPAAHGPMKVAVTGVPFQRVAMDIIGPFPKTAKGNMYVLIIGDYFTKWVKAYPMSDMEATTVAKCLYDFICRFGALDMLHTDQGRNFESALISELHKLLGITKTRTTPYHPQLDGMIRCFNRTLLSMLSTVLRDEGEDNWEVALPAVMLAYRSSPHQTTHQSPFMLTFGREVRLPFDVMFARPVVEADVYVVANMH